MKWTSEKPTKPGWYWWLSAPNSIPVVVLVLSEENSFLYCGKQWPLYSTHKRCAWAGPIEEPTE